MAHQVPAIQPEPADKAEERHIASAITGISDRPARLPLHSRQLDRRLRPAVRQKPTKKTDLPEMTIGIAATIEIR